MILFKTLDYKLYSNIIHYLLEEELFKEQIDLGNIVERIIPPYIYRQNFWYCETVLENLYNYSSDSFEHELDELHKLTLYKFMEFVPKNKKCFTDVNIKKLMEDRFNIVKSCEGEEVALNWQKKIYSWKWYKKDLFNDYEFLKIEKYYNKNQLKQFINKDNYGKFKDILPYEVKKMFDTKESLAEMILAFIKFVQLNIKKRNMAYLFWNGQIEFAEPKIQEVLENLLEAYFTDVDVDISRETLVGSGKIDFKFFRNNAEKVLLEVKKASSKNLRAGYEKQIGAYMQSWNCQKAFYVIIVYTDEDNEKLRQFLTKRKVNDVGIEVLDVRLKDKKLVWKNNSKINKGITKDVDKYFKKLDCYYSQPK